jgi:arylsulfatase A-like enzyme
MPMIRRNTAAPRAETDGAAAASGAAKQAGIFSLLILSAWCGLIAGLLEVTTIVLRKTAFDEDQLYKISRHFVWIIPVSNLCVLFALGVLGCGAVLAWPRGGRWLFARLICALTLWPSLLIAFPRIHALASLVVALGVASRLVPFLDRRGRFFRRFVVISFPVLVTIVAILRGSVWMGDRIRQQRENASALPRPGSPNVLLIVMDTVAAGHLNLSGYGRPTSPTLVELAERGILFNSARATSSWTLPSHASMFTGRWYHELSVGWRTPLDGTFPTLAGFLADRGYATAGIVANTYYCATDSGLSRGFTRYQDFIFPELTALKTAVMVRQALEVFEMLVYFTEDWLDSAGIFPYVERVWRSLDSDRKRAPAVNRELIGWLSKRAQPERPFFAFLNYFDAHYPYQLPTGRFRRFGVEPTDKHQRYLIQQWRDVDKKTLSPEGLAFAGNAYDDCIADLDEQIGKLIDSLEHSGVLERTWLIITSDHGESFGEHAGVYGHGTSLYETEVHVPLLVVPPAGTALPRVVKEAVSLRDLAATIVDIAGLENGSPVPGESLARFWQQTDSVRPIKSSTRSPSLAEVVATDSQTPRDYWGTRRQPAPLGAIKDTEWSYILREGDAREEMFHLRDDPKETHNLADEPAARATLEKMRALMGNLTGGPLLPQRFNR